MLVVRPIWASVCRLCHQQCQGPAPSKQPSPRLMTSSASPSSAPQHSRSRRICPHCHWPHPNPSCAPRSIQGPTAAARRGKISSVPASRPNRSTTATVGPAAPCPCGRHWRAARCCMLVCRAAGRRETDPHRGLQVEVEACCVQQDRDSGTAGCFLSCPMTHPISIAQIEI